MPPIPGQINLALFWGPPRGFATPHPADQILGLTLHSRVTRAIECSSRCHVNAAVSIIVQLYLHNRVQRVLIDRGSRLIAQRMIKSDPRNLRRAAACCLSPKQKRNFCQSTRKTLVVFVHIEEQLTRFSCCFLTIVSTASINLLGDLFSFSANGTEKQNGTLFRNVCK